ncbi:MAG: hypothetical protein FWD04_00855 [Conexibacteraceae bacterium]|nr:hypothetical protein [Conexibacteraceae bacterium]
MLRKLTVIAAILGAVTALAACGGSSSPNTSNASTGHTNTGLKLAECMRSHGVADYPDPGNGPNQMQVGQNGSGGGSFTVNGVHLQESPRTVQKAMSECQHTLPHGPPISGAKLAQIRQGVLKMAECMRSHGVPNFPDPQVVTAPGGHGIAVRIGGGPGTAGAGGQLNPQSPAFQRAQQRCGGMKGPPNFHTQNKAGG